MQTRQQRPKRSKARILVFILVFAILLAAMAFALVNIIGIMGDRSAARGEYDSLRELRPLPNLSQTGDNITGADNAAQNEAQTLQEINPEYIGWISIDGTSVDYPVVRGTDNAKYLNTTFEGNYNPAGTPFMDYRNTDAFSSLHTIIYAHNMKDGTMFGSLANYLNADYLNSHREIEIVTQSGSRITYTIFAAKMVLANDPAYRIDFASNDDYAAFASALGAQSAGSGLLTLSTCTNGENDDERVLVHAVRMS